MSVNPWKQDKLIRFSKLARKISIDLPEGVELHTNCSMVISDHQLEEILKSHNNICVLTSHNKTKFIRSIQKVVTCVGTSDGIM